jgi:glycerol-3-phosphate dehydrogenase (NAD(P)+)
VKSCEAIGELARRHGVDTPIVDAVRRVCAGERSARDVGDELINRERKREQGTGSGGTFDPRVVEEHRAR